MKNTNCLWIIALIFCLGCSKSEPTANEAQDFVALYGGKPFKGTAKGKRSQDGQVNYQWTGEANIVLMDKTADSVSLVLMADFGEEGAINFKVRGAYDGQRFFTSDPQQPAVFFEINDGRVNSNIKNDLQTMLFSGSMSPEKAFVQMEVAFLQASGIFPAGSVFDMQFDTTREGAGADDTEGCQTRLVPIWSPSGVTMGMVPDC